MTVSGHISVWIFLVTKWYDSIKSERSINIEIKLYYQLYFMTVSVLNWIDPRCITNSTLKSQNWYPYNSHPNWNFQIRIYYKIFVWKQGYYLDPRHHNDRVELFGSRLVPLQLPFSSCQLKIHTAHDVTHSATTAIEDQNHSIQCIYHLHIFINM